MSATSTCILSPPRAPRANLNQRKKQTILTANKQTMLPARLLHGTALASAAAAARSQGLRRMYATSSSGYGDPEQTGYGVNSEGEQSPATAAREQPGREPVEAGKKAERKKGEGKLRGVGPERFAATHGGHRPEPKINAPHAPPETAAPGMRDEAVEKHNREMSQRYDHQPHGGEPMEKEADEKVDKEFWKGKLENS
jgi:hypothetical protein